MNGEELTTTKGEGESAHIAVVSEMFDTLLAYKHERKRIVSVRVRVYRQTRGCGGLSGSCEWVGSCNVVSKGEGAPVAVVVVS